MDSVMGEVLDARVREVEEDGRGERGSRSRWNSNCCVD